jgi:hypothetical protein
MFALHTSQDISIDNLLVQALDEKHYNVACLAKALVDPIICSNIKSQHFWIYYDTIKLWRLVENYYVIELLRNNLKQILRSKYPTATLL